MGYGDGKDNLAAGANEQVQAEFEKRKGKAFSVLVLNVSTSQLYLIYRTQPQKRND